jgi:3-dehydroquinate synthase
MVKAAEISLRHGFCDRECVDRIRGLVKKTGLPATLPQNVSPDALIQGLEVDKKSAAGKIKFVMCAGIGKTRFHNLSPAEILACLRN